MRIVSYMALAATLCTLASACINRSELPGTVVGGLSTDRADVPADGTAAAILEITVVLGGTPVENASVRVTSTGPSTITQPLPTDGNGRTYARASSTTISLQTFTGTVTAEGIAAQLPQTAMVNFTSPIATAVPPSASMSSFSALPPTLVADGFTPCDLVVLVRDATGVPVPGQAVVISSTGTANVFTASDTHNRASTATGNTDNNGLFSATFTSTTAELKVLTAVMDGFALSQNVTMTPDTVSTITSQLSASPNTVVADGTSTIALVTTALDASGNPLVGATVTLGADGNRNVFTPPSGTTNAVGVFNATVTSTLAQSENVTATIGSVTLHTQVMFKPGQPVQGKSSLIANPNNVTADNVSLSTLTLSIQDAQGNPIPNQAASMSASGNNVTLTPITSGGATDANGVYVETLASSQAGTKVVTATSGPIVQQANVVFVAGAPSGSSSTIVASPNLVTTDNNTTTTLTVTVVDASLNPVPNVVVNLSGDGNQNYFAQSNGLTSASGIFSTTLYSPLAQTENVVVTGSNFTTQTLMTFTPGAPGTAKSTLVAAPTSVAADGLSTTLLTFTVKDAQGNLAPNASATFASNGNSNTFPHGSTGVTNAVGVFTATMSSTKAQIKTITATAGAATKTVPVAFTAGQPNNANSTITISPTSVSTDAGNDANIVVTLEDVYGNLVSDGTVVNLSASGGNNTFSPPTGTTVGGVFTSTVSSTLAQNENVIASGTGYSIFTPVAFTAGAATTATSAFTVSPTSLTADGVATTVLTFTVRDAQGNVVPSAAATFTSDGNNNTFPLGSSGNTTAAGVFSATMSSTKAQVKNLTAKSGAAVKSAMVTFVGGSPNSTMSKIVATPSTLVADNATQSSIVVTLQDAFGNLAQPTLITMGTTGGNDTFTPPTGTSSNGVFTFQMKSKTAQVKTITATETTASESANITFTSGPPAQAQSAMVITGSPVVANNANHASVTVTLRDQFGNLVPGWTFTLSATNTSAPQLSATSVTNNAGVFTYALASQFAGTKHVYARTGSVSLSGAVTFSQPAAYCSNPQGSFYQAPAMWQGAQNNSANFMTSADLNSDGYMDFVETDVTDNAIVVGLALGNGRYASPVSYAVGSNPNMIATCLLDGDTNPDVVVVNTNDGTVTAFLGSANGTLSVTPGSPITVSGTNMGTGAIQCTDVTSDNLADVIVSSYASKRFYILPGNGAGGFGTIKTQNVTSPPFFFTTGDVNQDGNTDIVYVEDANHAEIIISKGGGTFNAPVGKNIGTGTLPVAVALADLDGKNGLDIVTVNNGTSNASILLNNGTGTYPSSSFVTINASNPTSLWLADLNGDGNVEILAGSVNDNNITITMGQGNATFGIPKAYPIGSAPKAFGTGKVNNDASLDVVVAIGGNFLSGAQVLLGNGDGTVKDYAVYATGNIPAGIATGDLNGDGWADLVVAAMAEVDVFLNTGVGGTFGAYVPYTTSINAQTPKTVNVADLDGDGDLDIVTAMTGSGGGIVTMLNAGNGTFYGGTAYATPSGNDWGAAIADFNNDGSADVATGYRGGNNIWVALGSPTGVLGMPYSVSVGPTNGDPAELAAGDINGDGNQDLVVALFNTDLVGVLIGSGNGNFVNQGNYVASSNGAVGVGGVVLTDLNLDGNSDLMVTETLNYSASTMLGNGTGVFTSQWTDNGNEDFPYAVTAGDLNGDGVPDMLVASFYQDALYIHLGNGDGTVANTLAYASGHGPYYMVVADFDHDGHMDIASAAQNDNTIGVRLWSACP